MAQKTLINGTSYEISGGSVLKDGTKYQIGGGGKALIGGTGYDIVISKPIIITVAGGSTETGNQARAYVTYNGENYASGSFEVQPGKTLKVFLHSTSNKEEQQITLNGVVVASYGDYEGDYYNVVYYYTPTKSANIAITMHTVGGGAFVRPVWSTAAIVEEG